MKFSIFFTDNALKSGNYRFRGQPIVRSGLRQARSAIIQVHKMPSRLRFPKLADDEPF
jgi:hypothetical protein